MKCAVGVGMHVDMTAYVSSSVDFFGTASSIYLLSVNQAVLRSLDKYFRANVRMAESRMAVRFTSFCGMAIRIMKIRTRSTFQTTATRGYCLSSANQLR